MNPIYAVLVVFILCAGVCFIVANKRKSNIPFWVTAGFLAGPFAIPFVFFAKPDKHRAV